MMKSAFVFFVWSKLAFGEKGYICIDLNIYVCVYLCVCVCQYWPALRVLFSASGLDTEVGLKGHKFRHS